MVYNIFRIKFAIVLIITFCIPQLIDAKPRIKKGKNKVVLSQPVKYKAIHAGGKKYYYKYGRFYKWSPTGYVAIRAPFGAVITSLPFGYHTVVLNNNAYYYYDGIFYKHGPHGYIVINPPSGVMFSTLPEGYKKVIVENNSYYVYDGIYYRKVDSGYIITQAPVKTEDITDKVDTVLIEKKYYTVMVKNSNGSQTPVKLEQIGEHQWKGPKGEIYSSMPSQEQLKGVYGF